MDDAEGSVTSYTLKPSLAGASRQFKLTNAGLVWEVGDQRGTWPYATISAVRLSYWPVQMQSWQFRADIDGGGPRLVVLSTTWKGFSVETQDEAYRGFMLALHRRLAESGGNAAFYGGMRPVPYALAVGGMLIVFAIVMVALLARALATGAFVGALLLLAFAAMFTWQFGGFIRRNKPCIYTPDALPPQLLP